MSNNKYIKISESGYIKGTKLETEYLGNIQMVGKEISFSGIEFDARVILYWNHFICSKDTETQILDQELYKFISTNKDGTTSSFKVEDIKSFEFSGCRFTEDVYFNLSDNCRFSIDNCTFEKTFSINKHPHPQQKMDGSITINQLAIEETIFKKHFSMESCFIKNYRIQNVEFEGDARFFNVEFRAMYKNVETEEGAWFTNSVFHKSAIFEKVIFEEFVQLRYTIFKGYTLFRDIKFEDGLDLDYTNIEKEINFYNLEIENHNIVSRETFRIIKNQFEKINNKIEANKYHSLELGKYKEELEKNKTKNWKEYIVFLAHWLSSQHSTNWFRAFWLIGAVSFITVIGLNFELTIKLFCHPSLFKIEYLWNGLNEFGGYSYILNKDEKLLKSPWILLFNKMSLSYLYYQFLMSVRKDTRK